MTAHPASMTSSPPDSCRIAFKEWAGVCEALGDGRQSLILRKGGIAENPGGFVPEHDVFWLFPTYTHQVEQGLRVETRTAAEEGMVELGALAKIVGASFVDRPENLDRLAGFHVWTEETIRKRFEYRKPGLWVLGVRVFRRPDPWRLTVTPDQAGCKSWVELDAPLSTLGAVPVLDDGAFGRRMADLDAALGLPSKADQDQPRNLA